MKKIVFALLALALSACSKDENNITPSDGQYVGSIEYNSEYGNSSTTFCLIIENGLCSDFTIYTDAERFNYYRPADIRTNGSYPKYTYRINDFTVQAHFTDLKNFTADLSGGLRTHDENQMPDVGEMSGEVHGVIELKATDVHFMLDNTPLDANSDGLLDSKQ